MSKALLQQVDHSVNAAFGKAAKADAAAAAAAEVLAQVVADAREKGAPENLIEAAARRVNMPIPQAP